ncbi:MAG: lipoate--protein ligase family protein [Bryobacterales bacterium]
MGLDTSQSVAADSQPTSLALLDLTLPTPEENLALDEALLNENEERARGGEGFEEVLRLWESPVSFVALGSTGRLSDEVHTEECRREGIPVLRRSSGGGTVLAGPGCLCFSLILGLDRRPELRDIHASYRAILTRIATCLAVEGLAHRGISDLAIDSRKISGNAQRRKSRVLLHHGTLLYDFDLQRMERLLGNPPRQPDYRAGRAHGTFTMNLNLSAAEIKLRLARCWNAPNPGSVRELPDLTLLLREKYANRQWIERF